MRYDEFVASWRRHFESANPFLMLGAPDELLERARRNTAAREHHDVRERDVLDSLPQRPLRYVASLTKYAHAPRV